MNRYTPRAKNRYVFWSRALAGAIVLFPLSLNHVDFRAAFGGGLAISAHKSSPAYAAFEDLNEEYSSEGSLFPDQAETLTAGTPLVWTRSESVPVQRRLAMSGLTIKAPRAEEPKPIYVAGHSIKHTPVAAVPISNENLYHDDSDPHSIGHIAATLARQELASAGRPVVERVIRSQTGTPIIIRKSEPEIEEKPAPVIADNREFGYVSGLTPLNQNPADIRPLWLNGQIEMTGGLAFVGPETHIVVKRVHDGQTYERGRIWVTEAKFEIFVKKPVGFLVAELQTRDGRVLGRGDMNLVHLSGIPQKDNRVHDIRLALRPTTEGASFRTISGHSHGQQMMPVADAQVEIQGYDRPQRVNDDGVATEAGLNRASSFVARASAKDHWPTLVMGQAEEPQNIKLFSNNLVNALVNLTTKNGTDRKEAMHAGIVWGAITQGGQPQAGVHVEMAGGHEPVYFNDMYLPDPAMKATGPNGLFAFTGVRTGVQALRVKRAGRMYPAQVFPAEDKHVTYVQTELREGVVSQFKVMDVMQPGKAVSARIRLVGTEEAFDLNGEGLAEYAVAANPFMVEAEAGLEYEMSRVTLAGAPQLVYVPLVRRKWLYELYAHKNVAPAPGRGTVMGFVDGQDFEIELSGYAAQDMPQILYFDAQGKPLDTRTGVAGGGFVIFNAPPGVQTLYIHPTQSRESFSQVVVAEPEFVHVVTYSPSLKR